MGQIVCKVLLLGAAVLGVAGCQGSGSRPPSDPLFVSRKPIEVKAAYSPPTQPAQLEQLVPPSAVAALTARDSSRETDRVVAAAR